MLVTRLAEAAEGLGLVLEVVRARIRDRARVRASLENVGG